MPTFADQYAEAVFELQRHLADTYGVSIPWGTLYATALYLAAAAPRLAVAAVAWWRHLNRNRFRPITH